MGESCSTRLSRVLFRIGQILIAMGFVCYVVAMVTTYWVERPAIDYAAQKINPNETIVTRNYGIFRACRQSASRSSNGRTRGNCGSLSANLNFIDSVTTVYIQFVMVLACILYIVGISMEVVQFLPIQKFRNFLAQNRVVELFCAIAAVLVLKGMVIFAGEIRSKAERVPGQEDEQTGWSFIVAMIGLVQCVFGVVLTTMFRELPIRHSGEKGGSWLRS
ncbi:uncharacterized protein LOC101854556 [Aplysia californica]|uniref:Uncharacterized protein LOC101854556 n=1 Tax=Aplysia californica TaxID=6500 RepID=A0ABM0ZVJ3_APLCA|nr:uncharacterized protein LOC101854556 [Aplysia californica]